MFKRDFRDVKGVLQPYKLCPHHREVGKRDAKTNAGKASRKRHKSSAKGQASTKAYTKSSKRKASVDKYNATDARRENAARYYKSEKGKLTRQRVFARWYANMKSDRPKYIMFSLRKKLYKVAKLSQSSATLACITPLCTKDAVDQWFNASSTDKTMSWSNYGDWHIGHRIAVAFFNPLNKDDIARCFDPDNLFPQWASENQHLSVKLPSNLDTLSHLYPSSWNGDCPSANKQMQLEAMARAGAVDHSLTSAEACSLSESSDLGHAFDSDAD